MNNFNAPLLPPPPSPPTMTALLTQFFNVLADPKVAKEGIAAAVLELENHKNAVAAHELRVLAHNVREAEHNAAVTAFRVEKADVERFAKETAAAQTDIAAREARVKPWIDWLDRKPAA